MKSIDHFKRPAFVITIVLLTTVLLLFAQPSLFAQVSNYAFAQTSATYAAAGIGGTRQTSAEGDDQAVAVTLPFTFNYNGTGYTSVAISSNGFLQMGTAMAANNAGSAYVSSSNNNGQIIQTTTAGTFQTIAALNMDLTFITDFTATGRRTNGNNVISNCSGANFTAAKVRPGMGVSGNGIAAGTYITAVNIAGGTITLNAGATSGSNSNTTLTFSSGLVTIVTGSSPNRTFMAQWSGRKRYSLNDDMDFQVRLYETSNVIEMVYNTVTVATSGTSGTHDLVQVGLKGASNADYNNRSSNSNWGSSMSGTSNAATLTLSNTVKPAAGLKYTWTPYVCMTSVPTGLNATSLLTTSATINWVAPVTAPSNGYQYYFNTTGVAPIASNTPSGNTGAGILTASLSGLSLGTVYYFWVRGNCGSGTSNWSAVGTFTTACNSFALTFSQGFEVVTVPAIPTCWTQQFVSGTKALSVGSSISAAGTSPNPVAATGNNRLLFPSYSNSGNQTRLYSPIIITTGTPNVDVEFKWYYSSSGGATSYLTEGVQLQWSTNGTTWTNAGSLVRRYGAVDGWQTITTTLPPGAGNRAVLYVGFLFTSEAGYDSYIDDIVVKAAPSCLPPSNVNATGITATGATLNWTASVTPPSSGYQWEVRTSGAAGSGSTGLANSGNTAAGAVTTASGTLNSGTIYYVYVRSNCGSGDFSSWTSAYSFTTPCAIITSLPWSEKFDGMSALGTGIVPPCWLSVASGGFNFSSSNAGSNSFNDPYSTPNYMVRDYGNQASYLWTPGFQLTSGITYEFSFKWVGDGYNGWTGDAFVNSSQSATGATALGVFVASGTTTTIDYTTKTYTFTPATTGSYYFGTRVSSNNTPFYLGLDDYSLRVAPPCNTGGTATAAIPTLCGISGSTTLSAVDYAITGGTITYQWQSSPNATFASGVTDIAGATNPLLANTGTISTTTYFRLKVSCSALPGVPGYSNIVAVNLNNPQVLTTMGGTRCGVGSVTLQATGTAGTTLNWYAANSGGVALGTGTSFNTPTISSTTQFYVSATSSGSTISSVGPSSPTTQGGSIGTQTTNWRVYFDVIKATVLQSVDVFPVSSGQTATLYVFNSAGTLLKSVTYTTSVSGGATPQTIPINVSLPVATNYNIYASGIPTSGLTRNTTGAVYPYTSTAINITGNGYDNTYFMCYYNWKFLNECESNRTAVTATVTPPPALALNTVTATICSGSSAMANVTAATVANFSSYSWSPATGAVAGGSPAGSTVTLSPTTNTTYTLSGSTAGGCVNQATISVIVNPAPPATTSASMCSGGAATISASSACSNFTNSGTSIAGTWNSATDPLAIQPIIFLPNSPTCEFDPTGNTMNYTTINFQVSVTGSYTFAMDANTSYDGMGYIVTGAFVPGTCPGTGTWVVGDDDSGPSSLEPLMTATLTAGVTYTLITTAYYPSSSTVNGNYNWTIAAPPGGQISTVTAGTMQWWSAASGGTVLGSGNAFNPVGVAGSGIPNNTSVGSYTYYASCSNNNTCRTAANFVIGSTGQWIGGTSTDWSNPANWCGGVPSINTDGTIVAAAPYKPILSTGTGTVRNLTIQSGATLAITNARMQISGTITASNSITATNGTIELNGSSTQTLSGSSFTGRTLRNLIASNSIAAASSAGDTLRITGSLSFGNVNGKNINSNDNITLVSNASGTARIADITNNGSNNSNTVSGKFVVERYVPARRAWRLMTAPISVGAQTINQAWQENTGGNWALNPRPGYGTHITGGTGRTTAQGYDQGPLNPSLYGFSGTTWNVLPATTNTELISNKQGYMLFVRGSRAINLPASTPSTTADATVLRPTGTVRYGTQPTITNASGGWTVIGNPFPSAISFNSINKTGVIGGVGGNNAFYLWDPNMGGGFGYGAFITFSWDGSTKYNKSIVSPYSGTSNIGDTGVVPSGAALLVNLNPGGSLTIAEKDKRDDAGPNYYLFRPINNESSIRATLYSIGADSSHAVLDGNLIVFNSNASKSVDDEDALKMNNFYENLSILIGGKDISIESRNGISPGDTLFYRNWNFKVKNYELELAFNHVDLPLGIQPVLEDLYLGTAIPLVMNDTSRFRFQVTSDVNSARQDRFRIVFKPTTTVLVTLRNLIAKVINKDVAVEWTVENEINIHHYVLETSNNGIQFVDLSNIMASGGNRSYDYLHLQPGSGDHFYRIRIVENSGRTSYSQVVKVTLGAASPGFSIYPNPVTQSEINLYFSQMAKGIYRARIFNNAGQLVQLSDVLLNSNSGLEKIVLKKGTASGHFLLELNGPNKQNCTLPFVIP